MKAAVVVFPGSNCDRDMKVALARSMGHEPLEIWHKDTELPDVDLIVIPGGFSYGDYLRSGAMAARSPIMQEVVKAANHGKYVLGVCNGFQVLTEAGLLPGTLMRNKYLKFICKDVYLRVETSKSAYTGAYRDAQVIRLPVAHHDGNFFATEDTLKMLNDKGMVAFRYADVAGDINDQANPNGSVGNIAGVFNKEKNVLGLMPHPERYVDPLTGGTDGKYIFDCLVNCLS